MEIFRSHLKFFMISFLIGLIGPLVIGIVPSGYGSRLMIESKDEAVEYLVMLGPILFVVTYIALVLEKKRDEVRAKQVQSLIDRFSVVYDGRTVALSTGENGSGIVMIKLEVSFREQTNLSRSRCEYNIFVDWKGTSKMRTRYPTEDSPRAREILKVLHNANPKITPVKWKPGVLTVSDKGLEYTEGPYDLGPLAEEGIVGNLTIVEGLKSVVEEVEAIWRETDWNKQAN